MKKIISATLTATILLGETFTLQPGWNLLGTIAEIPASQILANSNVKNVVIYKDGAYKATNKNEFTTIPPKSGFFVFTESPTIIELQTVDTSVELAKVDENGNEISPSSASWKILYIKFANLYVEMKNDYTVGQKYSNSEASEYCASLSIGNVSGWRLPTNSEFTGIGSLYQTQKSFFSRVDSENGWHHTSNGYAALSSGASTGITNNAMPVICVKSVQ